MYFILMFFIFNICNIQENCILGLILNAIILMYSIMYPCINSFCMSYLIVFKFAALWLLLVDSLLFLQKVKGLCTHLSISISMSLVLICFYSTCSYLPPLFQVFHIYSCLLLLIVVWTFEHTETELTKCVKISKFYNFFS